MLVKPFVSANPLQPRNADPPILVTLSGIVALFNLSQYANAESPMRVTLSGIVTLVNPPHPAIALGAESCRERGPTQA